VEHIRSERAKTEASVPYSKLYSLEDGKDRFFRLAGWISAFLSGAVLPSFTFVMGDMVDSLDPREGPEETLKSIKKLSLTLTLLGILVWVTCNLFFSLLIVISIRVTRKIKVAYLRSILAQDAAWFDEVNPQELGARVSKECQAIQRALGEKLGSIIVAVAMCISGISIAFTRGWSYSLVLLSIFPVLFTTSWLITKVMQAGFVRNMVAYSQSAGYAEQALNAIRVVTAFGQERKEMENYTSYLGKARQAGISSHWRTALVIAFFAFTIFGSFAFSYYIGSVWIVKGYVNDFSGEPYTSGDLMVCFFGVIFGVASLGQGAPNIKAVSEGRVAGKMAFDIIDRVPAIR